jgi:outer membrane protein TolC
VRDAEDNLKRIMADPQFLLSEDLEIIPTDVPFAAPLAIDQFAEVRTALDERSEIHQAKLAVEQARINTARAKNETLPQLDLTFQYQVDGLRRSPDSSFDNLTTNRYNSYNVILAFQVPIGQRADRANLQRAHSLESQAIVRLKDVADQVVLDVNTAVRTLAVDWDNVPPALDAVVAADANLRALQERTNEVSPAFLETELSGVEQLANTRANLLRVIIDYNIAIVALEASKGTLLRYNNVVASDETPRR